MPKKLQAAVVRSSLLGDVRVSADAAAVCSLFGGISSRSATPRISQLPEPSDAKAPHQPTAATQKRRRPRLSTAAAKRKCLAISHAKSVATAATAAMEAELAPRKKQIFEQRGVAKPHALLDLEKAVAGVATRAASDSSGHTTFHKVKPSRPQYRRAKRTEACAGGAAPSRDDEDRQVSEEATSAAAERLARTIFVGNIPTLTTRKQLLKHFTAFGPVKNVRLRSVASSNLKLSKRAAVINGAIDTQARPWSRFCPVSMNSTR